MFVQSSEAVLVVDANDLNYHVLVYFLTDKWITVVVFTNQNFIKNAPWPGPIVLS